MGAISLNGILSKVTKPARYSGGEWNSLIKDWEVAQVRVALIYPDLYEVGMSNLGLAILYDLLNRQPYILAERAYAPWGDMAAVMKERGIPLFSLESKRPLKEFDIIGFSLGYELTYTNLLNMLHLAQLSPFSAQRLDPLPLVIAGGSGALNPEPLADFIDLFVVGEGEEVILELTEVFRRWKQESREKEALLRHLARIPGIYVPRFYQASYQDDGRLAAITPSIPEASPVIERRIVTPLPPPIVKPVVPYIETIHDRGMVEIQRGCTQGCRFCQAGIIYRPLRERPPEEIVAAVDEMVRNCGYDEVSLLSLSTSDYLAINEVVRTLEERHRRNHLNLSLPSLRMDEFSLRLVDSIGGRKGGLTFAPEAGSERLRRAINKGASDEELLRTAEAAFKRGWTSLKLYFMMGLPTETEDDIKGIAHFAREVRRLGKKEVGHRAQVKVSIAAFVPKAHTPFQWVAQNREEELNFKLRLLSASLKKSGAQLSWQDPKISLLEGVFSRGDRRLGKVIYSAWQRGSTFDAWSECFNYDNWLQAFDASGLDPSFYAHRERPQDEIFPWAHIDSGVSPAFLRREYERTGEKETPDCRYSPCSACGLERWNEGCRHRLSKG